VRSSPVLEADQVHTVGGAGAFGKQAVAREAAHVGHGIKAVGHLLDLICQAFGAFQGSAVGRVDIGIDGPLVLVGDEARGHERSGETGGYGEADQQTPRHRSPVRDGAHQRFVTCADAIVPAVECGEEAAQGSWTGGMVVHFLQEGGAQRGC
jgi:hypothetical protein